MAYFTIDRYGNEASDYHCFKSSKTSCRIFIVKCTRWTTNSCFSKSQGMYFNKFLKCVGCRNQLRIIQLHYVQIYFQTSELFKSRNLVIFWCNWNWNWPVEDPKTIIVIVQKRNVFTWKNRSTKLATTFSKF